MVYFMIFKIIFLKKIFVIDFVRIFVVDVIHV